MTTRRHIARRPAALALPLAIIGASLAVAACGNGDTNSCDEQVELDATLKAFHRSSAEERQHAIEELDSIELPDNLTSARNTVRDGLEQLTETDAFDDPQAQAQYLSLQNDIDRLTTYLAQPCN